MIRVYLDNCSFNRPFDDQESEIIRLEAEAKMMIQERIRVQMELVWSYFLEFENEANPDEEVREKIAVWREIATVIQLETNIIIEKSKAYSDLGLSTQDSIHIASAIVSNADYFITTDKGIIKKRNRINEIKIVNPTEFIINE